MLEKIKNLLFILLFNIKNMSAGGEKFYVILAGSTLLNKKDIILN